MKMENKCGLCKYARYPFCIGYDKLDRNCI